MKMKYAFMSFSCPGLSLGEMLDCAKRYGYDGVEPRISARHKHGVEIESALEQRMALRRQAADSGIAICCIATSCVFADPARLADSLDTANKAIDLAADVGAQRLRVFGGKIPDGMSRAEAIEQVAGALRSLAGHAVERQVTICLETHDDWCNPEHVACVMRAVNHPAIAVNWDIMHPVRVAGVSITESFATLKPWIRHLHIHDGITRDGKLVLKPIGQGAIDHRAAIALLKTISYGGFISGEWIDWEPCETHLPRELAALKALETGK